MQPSKAGLRWLLIVPALCLPLVASFFYFVWFPGTVFGRAFYGGIKFFQLIWPFLAVAILRESLKPEPGPRRHGKGLLAGFGFGVVTLAVMFALLKWTPVGGVIYGNGDKILQKMAELGVKDHFILFALVISSFHAALEEFFWRYFAFGQLRRLLPLLWAVALAAFGFASHHIVVLSQYVPLGWAFALGLCVGLGGAVWSLIYQRFNSLAGPWLSHMMIDLGIMWVGWEILSRQ